MIANASCLQGAFPRPGVDGFPSTPLGRSIFPGIIRLSAGQTHLQLASPDVRSIPRAFGKVFTVIPSGNGISSPHATSQLGRTGGIGQSVGRLLKLQYSTHSRAGIPAAMQYSMQPDCPSQFGLNRFLQSSPCSCNPEGSRRDVGREFTYE